MAGEEQRQHRDTNHAHQAGSGAGGQNLTPEDRQFIDEHGDELSSSTKRARWIHTPDEHESHPGETLATRSHDVIRHWAEERGAQPTTVPGTEHGGRPGVLRFNFPGYGGRDLQAIGWDDWFKTFDDRNLVFLFQEHQSKGNMSNFFRLDNPEREDA
jgi:hypothetical protein